MDSELLDFARNALAAGIDRTRIAEALRKAGWSEADTQAALRHYADLPFPVPVPRPKPNLSAREVFLYLLVFGSLYVTAWHLGAMLFAFIDRAYPDPAAGGYARGNFADTVRWNISALVVALPLFLLTFRTVRKALASDPTKRGSWPRRWLTYLTLLFASGTLAGDLILLVYNLLGGEYEIRFLLKVATVAVIAGGIFSYFLSDMRREET